MLKSYRHCWYCRLGWGSQHSFNTVLIFRLWLYSVCVTAEQNLLQNQNNYCNLFGSFPHIIIIIIRCQIWNRHWRPCLSKHLCHQTTSKNLNPYFVHLLPSYKDYQEMLFFVCPYRVCLLLFQLKIRIPSLYVYTHVLKIPFASS